MACPRPGSRTRKMCLPDGCSQGHRVSHLDHVPDTCSGVLGTSAAKAGRGGGEGRLRPAAGLFHHAQPEEVATTSAPPAGVRPCSTHSWLSPRTMSSPATTARATSLSFRPLTRAWRRSTVNASSTEAPVRSASTPLACSMVTRLSSAPCS
jgi:hypothetical protein